jgi:hypothetical protein
MEEEDRYWTISLGLYPGILLGIRTYDYEDCTMHVLYLPFIDISLELSK